MNNEAFRPTVAIPPGVSIAEILRHRSVSTADFADHMQFSMSDVKRLLAGEIRLNYQLAERLHNIVGGTTSFWLTREANYRDHQARIADEREWLKEIPAAEIAAQGWIDKPKYRSEFVESCLSFFGVRSTDEWRDKYSGLGQASAYRTSPKFASADGPVAAWFRQGELVAASIECKPWSARRFREQLAQIRGLSRERNPSVFLEELTRLCAECGVAVAVVKAPSGCRHSGMTRFLTTDKAMLLLSFRYLSDDHFWFTFFHEAGHLLLHSHELLFIEGPNTIENQQEEEANRFSSSILIPDVFRAEFDGLTANRWEIVRFARKLGIAPGIVVGQLQHLGRLQRFQMNRLKRRYTWE